MKATVLQTEMLFSDFLLLFIFIGGGGGGWGGGGGILGAAGIFFLVFKFLV